MINEDTMINDLHILKMFCSKQVYKSYAHLVQTKSLAYHIKVLLQDFGEYFTIFDRDITNYSEFYTWFIQARHPNLPEATQSIYKSMLEKLTQTETGVIEDILKEYQKRSLVLELEEHFRLGFNLEFVESALESYKRAVSEFLKDTEDEDVVQYEIEDLFKEANKAEGLRWRLNFLNEAIGGVKKGQLIIIAAYTGTGKTAFAISEATYMAQQVKEGCVLWLNNEEKNEEVIRKIWKSTLNCTAMQLQDHPDKAKEAFIKKMRGDINRIKFVDIRKKTMVGIKKLFEKYNPSLVIIDQADKIPSSSKAFSDHVVLRNIYSEIRTLANTYCPIFAISQADVSTLYKERGSEEYTYVMYPHHRQLDGSKVGKPGEADAIIMIGRRSENSTTRGLNVSKNKMNVEGLKCEVNFDGERCRFTNPTEVI